MDSKITDALYNALKLKYQAEYQEANATLLVYFSNPVGIGEHPQHLEEMDKQMTKMVDAQDKLDLLTRKFENVRD